MSTALITFFDNNTNEVVDVVGRITLRRGNVPSDGIYSVSSGGRRVEILRVCIVGVGVAVRITRGFEESTYIVIYVTGRGEGKESG